MYNNIYNNDNNDKFRHLDNPIFLDLNPNPNPTQVLDLNPNPNPKKLPDLIKFKSKSGCIA